MAIAIAGIASVAGRTQQLTLGFVPLVSVQLQLGVPGPAIVARHASVAAQQFLKLHFQMLAHLRAPIPAEFEHCRSLLPSAKFTQVVIAGAMASHMQPKATPAASHNVLLGSNRCITLLQPKSIIMVGKAFCGQGLARTAGLLAIMAGVGISFAPLSTIASPKHEPPQKLSGSTGRSCSLQHFLGSRCRQGHKPHILNLPAIVLLDLATLSFTANR